MESILTARAARQGTTPEMMALQDLHDLYKEERQTEDVPPNHSPDDQFAGKTLAEVLAGRIGTIRSSEYTGLGISYLSEHEGEDFAEHLAEKRRQGRL